MTLNLVIIGETGQLARALTRASQSEGFKVKTLNRAVLDLTWDEARISKVIASLPRSIDALILAAAYTAVDAAETDERTAFAVNGAAPGFIAKACALRGLPLVHISTDYVFNGTASEPYKPDDVTNPINAYGRSKRAGEIAVEKAQARSVIIRTSWLFDGQGANFLTSMLRLAHSRSELSIVDDQMGRPTYAGHLADAVLRAVEALCSDADFKRQIFHVTGSGDPVSWAGFAKAIFQETSSEFAQPIKVRGIASADYPTDAERPKYSVLDLNAFETKLGYSLPNWREGLRAALSERPHKA